MDKYQISELPLLSGRIGIAPMPGRTMRYEADLNTILRWGAGMVLTMTEADELGFGDAETLGRDLEDAGVIWRHLPIRDMGAPPPAVEAYWPETSATARKLLSDGGRVLAHCFGGCGRSGMALMRLMVEAGERPDHALMRLRTVRPCAVETEAQRAWASGL